VKSNDPDINFGRGDADINGTVRVAAESRQTVHAHCSEKGVHLNYRNGEQAA